MTYENDETQKQHNHRYLPPPPSDYEPSIKIDNPIPIPKKIKRKKGWNEGWKKKFVLNIVVIFIILTIVGISLSTIGPEQSDRQLHVFTNGKVGFAYNPPTLVNNSIYIGTSRISSWAPSSHNCFYKFDSDLNKIWEYSLGKKEVRGAAVLDYLGNIYFAVNTDRSTGACSIELYSLDNMGNFRWSRDISDIINEQAPAMVNPAISKDDVIYVGGSMFYAFDMDGNEVWRYEFPAYAGNVQGVSAPIIDMLGDIYFIVQMGSECNICSLDKDGNERWRYITNEWGFELSSPAFTTDYSHIIVALNRTIFSFETTAGNVTWQYMPPEMQGDFRATPAVDDNNVIYIGCHGDGDRPDDYSIMYAIKADGSGILWQNKIGSDLYSSPALGNDRILYVGSEGVGYTGNRYNRLHALDMASGEIIWSAQLEMDVIWSSPAISSDGTLYIACMDGLVNLGFFSAGKGMIYSFRTDSTGLLPMAGSPSFHGGNSNTGRRD